MTCLPQTFAELLFSERLRPVVFARCLRVADLRLRCPWYLQTELCQGLTSEAAQRQHHDWLTMQGVSPVLWARCQGVTP